MEALNVNESADRHFAATVSNAVAVVSHVWGQIYALKGLVDQHLPEALKTLKMQVVNCDEEEKHVAMDETENVYVALMWPYELKRSGRDDGRGRKKIIGRIFMGVRIAPEVRTEPPTFIPYLTVQVAKKDVSDEYELEDLGGPGDYEPGQEGCRLLPEHLRFTEKDIAGFEWSDDEDGLWAAAVFMPLDAINSENVRDGLIEPTKELARYCMADWDKVKESA
jgi:hypothetical protein